MRGATVLSKSIRPLTPLLWLGPLSFLWLHLIRHLSVEWSLNPQYAYGWGVPFLCAYLLWREVRSAQPGQIPGGGPAGTWYTQWRFAAGIGLAVAYAPTRLVEEANPEWRLVSWALALEVVGLTWLLLASGSRPHGQEDAPLRRVPGAFPFFFFLVAVPWPTMVESPCVRSLSTLTTHASVVLLQCFGIPALFHGNVIEIASGFVGVEEACSGIRSVQAAVMLALFFGEVYRLRWLRRLLCLGGALGLAIAFNLLRTTLLASVVALKDSQALANWHDLASISLLLGCFCGNWFCAASLRKRAPPPPGLGPCSARPPARLCFPLRPPGPGIALACWIAAVEFGTEGWYRIHELGLPQAAGWRPVFGENAREFRRLAFSAATRRLLRFDEGSNVCWKDDEGRNWQAIFLRWAPGRTAVHLARNHTPEDCLTAGGRRILSRSGPILIPVGNWRLPFRAYAIHDNRGPATVFYCLWEDRAAEQSFAAQWLTYQNRLIPVLTGRRHRGQRSLELAVWGAGSEWEAQEALRQMLPRSLKPE